MCDYETEYLDVKESKFVEYKCPHRALNKVYEDGKKYCIFHSKREDKDVEKFYKGFKLLYEDEEHNFTGFVFPRDFSFNRLSKETGDLKFINAVFAKSIFLCEADFSGAEFSGGDITNFRSVEFNGKGGIDFSETVFSCKSGVDFIFAKFKSNIGASFISSKFFCKGKICFDFAEFSEKGKVYFVGTFFPDETEVNFRDVIFENPENVTFDGVDLSKCRLIGTDLEKVNIKEVFWKNKRPGKRWRLGRIKVYDETFQSGTFYKRCKGNKKHYQVYQLYNQLLLNYERTYRHHEAGDFYAGQMDMRRRGKLDGKWFSRFILFLYKIVAEYGERPVRVFAWFLFILLLFGLIYTYIGFAAPLSATSGSTMGVTPFVSQLVSPSLLKGLEFSLDIMTLGKVAIFKTGYILKNSDSPWVSLLKLIHVVSGASLLTLFLLSVRRRFRKV